MWDCFSIPALNSSSQNIGSHLIILEIHCLCHKFLTVIETSRSKRGKTTDVPLVVGQEKQVQMDSRAVAPASTFGRRRGHNTTERVNLCLSDFYSNRTLSLTLVMYLNLEKKHQIPDHSTRHFKKSRFFLNTKKSY